MCRTDHHLTLRSSGALGFSTNRYSLRRVFPTSNSVEDQFGRWLDVAEEVHRECVTLEPIAKALRSFVIVQLQTGVSGDDGGQEANRGLVGLPVRHFGGCLVVLGVGVCLLFLTLVELGSCEA